jgi:hypothetical protein
MANRPSALSAQDPSTPGVAVFSTTSCKKVGRQIARDGEQFSIVTVANGVVYSRPQRKCRKDIRQGAF